MSNTSIIEATAATLPEGIERKATVERERSLKTSFVITSTKQTDKYNEEYTAQVTVYSYHSKERKEIVSTTSRELASTMWVRQSLKIGGYEANDKPAVAGYRERIARFNMAALRELHEQVVREVEVNIEQMVAWGAKAVEENA